MITSRTPSIGTIKRYGDGYALVLTAKPASMKPFMLADHTVHSHVESWAKLEAPLIVGKPDVYPTIGDAWTALTAYSQGLVPLAAFTVLSSDNLTPWPRPVASNLRSCA